MKLIYLYIHDSGVFKNVNINLGSKLIFKYDAQTRDLEFEQNNFFIADFFDVVESKNGHAKISSVSAIVGENGAGKTTILEFIKNSLARGAGGFTANAIVAFEDSQTGEVIVHSSNDLPISKKSLERLKSAGIRHTQTIKKVRPHHPKLTEKTTHYKIIPEDQEIDYVFFSNIFDKKIEQELSGLHNISTNFLLRQDTYSRMDQHLLPPNQFIEEHRFREISRELSFISAFKGDYQKYLPFELPTQLLISITPHVLRDTSNRDIPDYWSSLQKYRDKVLRSKSHLISDVFQLDIRIATLLTFFYESYEYFDSRPYDSINQKPFDSFIQQDFKETFTRYLDYLLDLTQNYPSLHNQLLAIKQFHAVLQNLDQNTNIIFDSSLTGFDISKDEDRDQFFKLYDAYKNTYKSNPYLNFDWRDLSTGEKAMLNIYSRFYYLSDAESSKRDHDLVLKKNVIILLDEFEAYLHPTWQKEILFNLINVLPVILKSGDNARRNIQIILATNAPLLISDIPVSHIIFLKRERVIGQRITIVTDSLNEQHQTFAANIHTLLSDSFFMTNGLMGSLATKKINEVINNLRKGAEINRSRAEEIRKIIQQIGEPILKHKLTQMYNDRFNMDIHNRLDAIEKHLDIGNDG
jgi:predicted ATP-binding protein involved in virulence